MAKRKRKRSVRKVIKGQVWSCRRLKTKRKRR